MKGLFISHRPEICGLLAERLVAAYLLIPYFFMPYLMANGRKLLIAVLPSRNKWKEG